MEQPKVPVPAPRSVSKRNPPYENCGKCTVCKRITTQGDVANTTCTECCQSVCSDCLPRHNHPKRGQGLGGEDAGDYEDNNDYLRAISMRRSSDEDSEEIPRCQFHQENMAKYCCMTCETTICSICSVQDAHVNHVKCTFKEVGETVQKGLKRLEKSLTNHLTVVKDFLDTAVSADKDMEKEHLDVRDQIKKAADALINEIQRKEETLLQEVDLQRQEQSKLWTEEIDTMLLQMGKAKSFLEKIEDVKTKNLPAHALLSHQDTVKDGKKLDETLTQFCLPTRRKLFFSADPIESLSLGITQLNIEQDPYVNLTWNASKMRSMSERSMSETEDYQQRQLLWEVVRRGSKVGELCSPTAVSFTPDQSLVVSEVNNHRLQVFSNSGESAMIIGQGMLNPKDVAVNDDGTIYLADSSQKAVLMFDAEGRALGQWGKGYLKYPRGLTILPDGNVVVADKASNIVSIHTPSGELKNAFGMSKSAVDLKEPINVTCDSHQRIIVNDQGNNSIKIFDKHGKLLCMIDAIGGQPLPEVQGLCVDASDNILMSFYRKHAVVAFSPDGRCLGICLKQEDGISWPAGIATALGAQLAVTETFQNANHFRLALYKL